MTAGVRILCLNYRDQHFESVKVVLLNIFPQLRMFFLYPVILQGFHYHCGQRRKIIA